ncbi:MAG: signal peptidase II, partial [Paracoccaceae bacterium]
MAFARVFIAAFIVFWIDRLSKIWIVEWMDLRSRVSVDVYPPFFNLRMAWNRGINFGLFGGDAETTRYILSTAAILIVCALLVWVRRQRGAVVPVSVGLIIGGAVGNVLDRINYGAVADFINVSCCGINNPYSFNPAD